MLLTRREKLHQVRKAPRKALTKLRVVQTKAGALQNIQEYSPRADTFIVSNTCQGLMLKLHFGVLTYYLNFLKVDSTQYKLAN